jgi:hypothetical protein
MIHNMKKEMGFYFIFIFVSYDAQRGEGGIFMEMEWTTYERQAPPCTKHMSGARSELLLL